jgi:hypothetical protein
LVLLQVHILDASRLGGDLWVSGTMTDSEKADWREAGKEMESPDDLQGLLSAYYCWVVTSRPESEEILEKAIQ